MASPKIPSCSFDDKDLDDAALLALDSAAASISGSGESPQIKRPDTQAPASDSHRSPQLPGSAEARSTVPVQPSQPEMYQSPDSGRSGSNLMRATVTHGQSKENEVMRNRSSGKFRSVSLFKEYQKEAMAILDNTDYMMIWGDLFIKKSGWRKLACYFGLSFEIKGKVIEFDEKRDVRRAEFVVRAFTQDGRFSDGWGSCDQNDKRYLKPNLDIPSTAETRAKNKACQDLLGIGQYRPGLSQKY